MRKAEKKLTYDEKLIEKLKKKDISPMEVMFLLYECRDPVKNIKTIISDLIKDVICSFDDDGYLYCLSVMPYNSSYFDLFNEDERKRYVDICLKEAYINEAAFKYAKQFYSLDFLSDFCVRYNMFYFINYIDRGDADKVEDVELFYRALESVPYSHSAKSILLDIGDLTLEQKVFALKSLAQNGSSKLKGVYKVNLEELKMLSMGVLIKLLDNGICGFQKVELDEGVDLRDVKKLLFPYMMESQKEYDGLTKKLEALYGSKG